MGWIQEFFKTGFYQRAYWFRIDAFETVKEVEGIIKLLKPKLGSLILDWCGGWGRHAIELVKRGFRVTLLDLAPNHIAEAKKLASEAGVELDFITADFRETPVEIQADYAINMFTSGIGFLTEEDDILALRALHAALKPGARFLLDTMNLFWLVKNYQPRGLYRSEDGKRQVIDIREFDFMTNRNHSLVIYDEASGQREEQKLDLRIYSPAELARVLRQAGFKPQELYGDLEGSPFTFDSRRIVFISERR